MALYRTLIAGLLAVCPVLGAQLETVSDFGAVYNTSITMSIYVPDKVKPNPAVVLALHGCFSSGKEYYQTTKYASYADSLGFIVVFPSSVKDSHCWDVASSRTLNHGHHGDSEVLANIAAYTVSAYGADASRIFITGTSSGCMMTNVAIATYPDVYAAATCYSGVAAGCFEGSPGSSPYSSNLTCADGNVRKTGEEWAAQVHAMYPGYTGSYPRFKTWHGTADTLVLYENLVEQLKMWSTVDGVTFSHNLTETPQTGYTTMIYGDGKKLVGVSAKGVGHTVPDHPADDMEWFGLA